MSDETALWAWLLFESKLPPQRGKMLLDQWGQAGRSAREGLATLPAQAAALGLKPEEAALLHPPHTLAPVTALRWNEPLYPTGLRRLPLKLRPALLFYRGAIQALQRPVVYLPPAPLLPAEQANAQELLAQLLGEGFLPAAFQDSPQAALLLEEMADAEGEALLLVRCGSEQIVLNQAENTLLAEGRLLLLSPLPPTAAANPAWDELLEQLAAALAERLILTAAAQASTLAPELAGRTLCLTAEPPAVPYPAGLHFAAEAAEALLWLSAHAAPPVALPATEPDYDLPTVELPPLAPQEALQTLERQGRVPEALRRRLLGRAS